MVRSKFDPVSHWVLFAVFHNVFHSERRETFADFAILHISENCQTLLDWAVTPGRIRRIDTLVLEFEVYRLFDTHAKFLEI